MTPQAERARLEALLAPYDRGPAVLRLYVPPNPQPLVWLLHRLVVSRVNPHYDAAGQIKSTDFWLSFLPAFWPEADSPVGMGHCLKITAIPGQDTYILEMNAETPAGECDAEVELIDADYYPADLQRWQAWRAQVDTNPEAQAAADAGELAELQLRADQWED